MIILVLCTGNICRSPVAEIMLQRRLATSARVDISSAGTHALVGESMHPQMHRLLDPEWDEASAFVSRQLDQSMVEAADLIITMTRDQRSSVVELVPLALRKTFTLTELAALISHSGPVADPSELAAGRPYLTLEGDDLDIPDPYRKNTATFRKTFASISDAVDTIAAPLSGEAAGAASGRRRAVPVLDHLTVLESFPEPRPTTNPYIVMLGRALHETPGLTVETFAWRKALRDDYDVFHVHWPEILVSGESRLKKRVRQALFAMLLHRLRRRRVPIVRTMHNLELPTGISRRETRLLQRADRQTVLGIAINDTTPIQPGRASATILHGHYRDWYSPDSLHDPEPGRIAFFGLVRQYKGVDSLIRAFREINRSHDVSLAVAGKPSSAELASSLRTLAAGDDRIDLRFGFLSDDDLADHVSRAELVVLPYREMHNSGGVLTALSLDRPVLVPANHTNTVLADEVGHRWVQTYDGELSGDDITRAIEAVRKVDESSPNMSRRDWSHAGVAHAEAFRLAVDLMHA
ncbi:glycosyltransferase [Aeromicrobium sp.]|uniref:arsenate reductase/protein-tyrosine-phosphatase family protein n=1 Tax=Aeromicrobium sp. TaxID=1871063 RepID=UPI0025BED19E|nr:glycosyltransferase [Aeromicrobium sp.]